MEGRGTTKWYVISLRPRGEHAPLRRAAARHGASVLALSPWRLQLREDARAALAQALVAPVLVFTSPAAVRAAQALLPLHARPGQAWCAVGAGSAAALRRAGIGQVHAPARMDSEGLLALPALQDLSGRAVALVTAPGGRGEIAPALAARGARVQRVDVYERVPMPLSARALRALGGLDAPAVLALSSGEALQQVLAALSPDLAARLRGLAVVAASERLCALARALGFGRVALAAGPRPADLVAAAARQVPVA